MKILVLGGTGFVGKYVVKQLLEDGFSVRLLVRNPDKVSSEIKNKVELVKGGILDRNSLDLATQDIDVAINLVGIIKETKNSTFQGINFDGVKNLVNACEKNDVEQLIHISANGTSSNSVTKYFKSKYLGEETVMKSDLDYIVFKPSLMFGKGDPITSLFSKLAIFPLLFIPSKTSVRFQLLFVEDFAKIISKSIGNPKTYKQVIPLGGSEKLSFREMVQKIAIAKNKNPFLVQLPFLLAYYPVLLFEKFVSSKVISSEAIKLLQIDNVTDNEKFNSIFGDMKLTSYSEFLKSEFKP